MEGLQLIIGTDKRNPVFSLYRKADPPEVYVFFGGALLEVLKDDRDNPELKMLLGRLYNAKVKVKSLEKEFGYSYPTIRRFGDALKSGNAERMIRAFSGQGAPRKITHEIETYIRRRFGDIYRGNKYSYSQSIRDELKEIFDLEVTAETIRPLVKELKSAYIAKKKGRLH